MIPPIKQIVYMSTGEGGEILFNENYLHLTLISYKSLSFSHEFLTQMNYTLRNYKFIEFS